MTILSTPETQPFWDGVAAGELRLQRCSGCGRAVFYPRSHCPCCHRPDLSWFVASGRGTVHAVTVVHRAPPGFAAPYALVLVDLDEGARMLSRVLGDEPVTIGSRVRLEIARLTPDGPELPCFRPDPELGGGS